MVRNKGLRGFSAPSDNSLTKQKSYRKQIIEYFFVYTLLFAAISVYVLSPFYENGISLIWKIDGVPQYLLWLQYTGKYLRRIVRGLLHGKLVLQYYDFNIGLGGDVRTFLKMEPITFLALFVRKFKSLCSFYNWLTIIRIYMTGWSFTLYARYMKYDWLPCLAGSLIFTFSNYTYYQTLRHPQFAFATIMLPLLLIGMEQVLHKKNILFFSLMVAISIIGAYYFTYISTIFLGFYALMRFFQIVTEKRIREFAKLMARIILSYILGFGIGAFSFAPSIASLLHSSRAIADSSKVINTGSLWFYYWSRIPEVFMALIAPKPYVNFITTITVSVLIIPALVMIFHHAQKKTLPLRIGIILCFVFLIFPVFGYIFSGFSTVTNRWCYCVVFILAVIMMQELPKLQEIQKSDFYILAGVLVVYAASIFTDRYSKAVNYGFWMLGGVLILFLILKRIKNLSPRQWQSILCILIALNLGFNGWYINSQDGGKMASSYQNEDTIGTYFTGSRYRYLEAIEDDSFYRTDTDMMYNNYNNTSVALGYNGVSLYNSTINSGNIKYLTETESVGISAVNRTLSFDNRTVAEALACVKYFITEKESGDADVPYGFTLDPSLTTKSKTYDIYVNDNQLSIGYTYDTIVLKSAYEKMTALEKQQIMLHGAVIDDEDAENLTLETIQSTTEDIEQGEVTLGNISKRIQASDDLKTFTFVRNNTNAEEYDADSYEENTTKEDYSETDDIPGIEFSTVSKANCEVYLRLSGVSLENELRADINVTTDRVSKRAIIRPDEDSYKLDMDSYLINLGYYENEEDIEGELSFSDVGTYHIDSVEVYYVPMDSYETDVASLNQESLDNVQLSTNTVSGTISVQEEKILTFSIPYSVGWTAEVDGVETELIRVNTLYMGLDLQPGEHEIVLRYTSPGIRAGGMISAVFCMIYLILFILWIRKRKKQ